MSKETKSENADILKKAEVFLDSIKTTSSQKKQVLEELSKKSVNGIQDWLDSNNAKQLEAEAKDTAIRKEFVDKVESEKHFTPDQKNSLLQKLSNLKVGDTDGFTELIKQYSNYMKEYEKEEEAKAEKEKEEAEAKQPTEADPSDSKPPKKKGLSFAGRKVDEKTAGRVRNCYSDSKTAKKLKAEKEAKKTSKSK